MKFFVDIKNSPARLSSKTPSQPSTPSTPVRKTQSTPPTSTSPAPLAQLPEPTGAPRSRSPKKLLTPPKQVEVSVQAPEPVVSATLLSTEKDAFKPKKKTKAPRQSRSKSSRSKTDAPETNAVEEESSDQVYNKRLGNFSLLETSATPQRSGRVVSASLSSAQYKSTRADTPSVTSQKSTGDLQLSTAQSAPIPQSLLNFQQKFNLPSTEKPLSCK